MAELKAYESGPSLDSNSDIDKGKKIIDAKPSVIVAMIKIYKDEPKESKEGECLFHS